MEIKLLEHVNIRTVELEKMAYWYEKILGLKRGYRPPFGVDGIWLYSGAIPMVHLVLPNVSTECVEPTLEHFCMRASGLGGFLNTLNEEGIKYKTFRVPELRIIQVYISDPENNHMHIDFQPEEADALDL